MKSRSRSASASTARRNCGSLLMWAESSWARCFMGKSGALALAFRSDHIFQCDRHAHAAADTEGGDSLSCIALQHLVEKRHHDARAAAADGMSEGNGATIDIEAVAIEIQPTIAGQNLGSEGFVEFHQPKFVQPETMLDFQLFECRNRTDTHGARIDSRRAHSGDAHQRLEIVLLHEIFA